MAEQQTPGTSSGSAGMGSGSFAGGELGNRSPGDGQGWQGRSSGSPGRQDQGSNQKAGAKQKLADAAGRAGERVASGLDSGKDRAADELCRVADALRQTGNQLRDDNGGGAIQGYIGSAATQVDRLSSYVRSTSMREMVNSVEQFARQQPTLFVGGAFMLGLIGARFLKSSAESGSSRSTSMGGREVDADSDVQGRAFNRSSVDASVNVI